ncbi:coiled-coil domain-containing protein 158-like isoform X1 [Mya arenaria]|uniref:coiled-coil domain-containing protein 158-like isoform X1 n=1 Tax=Mya arenaria TaxID=6604 RepID=UPI0022E026BF|nr:coiled-coil domain-containing protein 158-like isoform X1 [Mya arenaria]
MASSAGFSFATSPPGGLSPQKSGRQNSTRKTPSAAQLLEQIRNLEAEGNKLRSDSSGIGGPSMFNALTDLNMSNSNEKSEQLPKFTSTSPSSLSALVDYSSEQKTISDLRLQLEKQRKETERLNTQLQSDGFSSGMPRASTGVHIPGSPSKMGFPGSPSKTGFSTLPSTELFSSRRPASVTGVLGSMEVHGPPSHLEKALKDSQEQVTDLRRRLMESSESGESQKRQFRLTVEDMKAKLHDTMASRDSMLELRQKECMTLETKIAEQSAIIRDLQAKIKQQEQALADTSKKADAHSRENFVSETTLSQVRMILVDAERRRGRAYFESDPASQQAPAMLVHTLERCIQEMLKDLEIRKAKNEELDREVQELKQTQTSDQHTMSTEYKHNDDETLSLCRRITQMTAEHERQIQMANERANNARKQASSLESQLSTIQEQHQQQLKLREESVTELENKIKHLREELHEERDKYASKRESLEQTLNNTEKEMAKLRTERDDATKNHASMESRVADLQVTINRLTRDLDTEKEGSGKYWEREGQLRTKQAQLEARLEEKTRDVERLEKTLASVKQECNATVSEKVSLIERQERERHMEKISSLTQQLSEVSEKCNRVSHELESTRGDHRDLRQQARDATDKADTLKVQLEAAVAERKHLTDMLTAKSSDFDRMSQERDYYFNIMDGKNNEAGELKSQKERLTIQLEEKEKSVSVLQEQLQNLQLMIESNSRNYENIREERDVLIHQLQETTSILEELKSSKDTMAKKMKIREKRLRELEGERQRVAGEIDLRTQEMAIIQKEKETLFKELKESRYEVVGLTEERDGLKKNLEGQKYNLERNIAKLQYRLKSTEQDLAMAQKALRKRESVDNTAVKMADKMQKEVTAKRSLVDTLQSKISWYQDQLDAILKEKGGLDSDKDKLKSSLNKALVQNQQLMVELETSNSRTSELKSQLGKLESSLEKLIHERKKEATLRNATTQAQVEMFEQEMTRMKLAHRLEVKEAAQKAFTQHKDVGENQTSVRPGTSIPQSQRSTLPQSDRDDRPEKLAQDDRLQAQKSSENYKEIGSELRILLSEMRNIITESKESPREEKRCSLESRERPERDSNRQRSKPQPKPRKSQFPIFEKKKPAFSHYRICPASSDVSYYSDAEVDDRIHNRSRSLTGNYKLYSPEQQKVGKQRQRSVTSSRRHRRSHSAEASFMANEKTGDSSQWTESDYRTSDYSPPPPDTDDTVDTTNTSREDFSSYLSSLSPSQNALDSDTITSLSVGSPIMESTQEDVMASVPSAADTQELCKRLEERIISLTQMGGNLQKENREMADLMKTQGKKLKKVKETEKKITLRKKAR